MAQHRLQLAQGEQGQRYRAAGAVQVEPYVGEERRGKRNFLLPGGYTFFEFLRIREFHRFLPLRVFQHQGGVSPGKHLAEFFPQVKQGAAEKYG